MQECPGTHQGCAQCGPDSCGQPCCVPAQEANLHPAWDHDRPEWFHPWCVDNCSEHVLPRWVEKASAKRFICDVEVSKSIFGATIHIMGAIEHEDTSCVHHADAWKIVELASVHCSSESECKEKGMARGLELIHDGYELKFTELGKNNCPEPRFTAEPSRGVLSPRPSRP